MNYIARSQFFRLVLLAAIACASIYVVQMVAGGTATGFLHAAGEDLEGASRYVLENIAYASPSAVVGGGLVLINPMVGIAVGSFIEGGAQLSDAAHDPTTGERRDIPELKSIWLLCLGIILCLFAYGVGQALAMYAKTDAADVPIAKRLSSCGAAFFLALLASALLSAKLPMMLGAIAAASCFKSTKVEHSSEAATSAT